MFPFVCPARREKVEKDVTRKKDKEGEGWFYHRNEASARREKRKRGKRVGKKGREGENALRVPGKPMILKEGREDAHSKRRNEATKSKASALHCVADPGVSPRRDGVNPSVPRVSPAFSYFSYVSAGLRFPCLFACISANVCRTARSITARNPFNNRVDSLYHKT